MSEAVSGAPDRAARVAELFAAQQRAVHESTDRLFGWLLPIQWLAAVIAAVVVSPLAWAGSESRIHPHVFAAVLLGGAATVYPTLRAWRRPGDSLTRGVIAVAQALMSVLLIHLSGGRIETHFHVFVSLAFLAFYRDPRLLYTASAVVAVDHVLRGAYWPQSIFGVVAASPWRWLEHASWIVFEDAIFLVAIRWSLGETRAIAAQRATLESVNRTIEETVTLRTAELAASEERFRTLSESAPIGIYSYDSNGRLDYTNEKLGEIAQLGQAEMLGDGWLLAVHPEDRERVRTGVAAALGERGGFDMESRTLRASGEVRWVRTHGRTLIHAGLVSGLVGTIEDFTEEKLAVDALARYAGRQERLARLAERALATDDLRGLFTEATHDVALALDVEYAKILELAPDGRALRLVAGVGWREGLVGTATVGAGGESQAGFTLASKVPVVVEDAAAEKRFHYPALLVDHGVTSGASVAIAGRERPFGVLGAHTRRRRAFGDEEVRYLVSVASVVAFAVERRRIEEALEQSEHYHRTLIDASLDLISVLEADGTLRFTSGAQTRLTGRSAEELAGTNAFGSMHPDDVERVRRILAETVIGGRETVSVEYRYRHKDGSWRTLESIARNLLDDPAVRGVLVASRDVTDRVEAEAKLRASETLFRSLVENSFDLVTILEADGRLRFASRAHESVIGYRPEELMGQNPFELIHPNDVERVARLFAEAVAGARDSLVSEYRFRHKNGSWRMLETMGRNLLDDPAIGGILVVSRDVTERVRAEEALRAARDAAEAADRAKGVFLANMSHEVRTPLNAILGTADLLLDDGLAAEQREDVATIRSSATALLQLLNDVLDMSKLESGKVTLERVAFDLEETIRAAARTFAAPAAKKGVAITADYPSEAAKRFSGDPGRIRQVLINLIGNAVKFTAAGHVRVQTEVLAAAAARAARVRIAVEDSGIGIAADELERIFEKFTQAESSTASEYGGTGLGLAISKELVERMGGAISVASEPGKGTTFTVELELALADEAPAIVPAGPRRARAALRGRVLIVDDDAVNRKVAERMVDLLGCEKEAAANGVEALAAVERQRYDAVLMDSRMPVMDGYEATAEIRRRERPGRRLPIIAFTANAGADERRRCLAAGMDDFVTKPVSLDALEAALAAVLGDGVERAPATHVDRTRVDEILDAAGAEGAAFLAELFVCFVADAPKRVAEIAAALAGGDSAAAGEAAHSLKGMSATVAAARLADLAAEIEKLAAAGRVAEARARIDGVERELALARAEIEGVVESVKARDDSGGIPPAAG